MKLHPGHARQQEKRGTGPRLQPVLIAPCSRQAVGRRSGVDEEHSAEARDEGEKDQQVSGVCAGPPPPPDAPPHLQDTDDCRDSTLRQLERARLARAAALRVQSPGTEGWQLLSHLFYRWAHRVAVGQIPAERQGWGRGQASMGARKAPYVGGAGQRAIAWAGTHTGASWCKPISQALGVYPPPTPPT